jgi:8-amino-7-oxononanoate synthase
VIVETSAKKQDGEEKTAEQQKVIQRQQKLHELLARQAPKNNMRGLFPAPGECGGRDFDLRDFSSYPDIKAFDKNKSVISECKVDNPYFRVSDRITNNHTHIMGRKLVNFSGYNYLGYSGDPFVSEQAKRAIDYYGTSPSASRLASGEKPVHGELEDAIAKFIGTESALVFAGGHATNVTVIGHFFNSQDLIIYDELSHNSVIEGCQLSGARRIAFAHNDMDKCEKIIAENINKYQKIVVVVEGAYSMDGDLAPLAELIQLRKKYPILVYVDEAHSLGTLGQHGRGVSEHFGIDPQDVDFWMGTLSKSLASNGGYIAGKRELIDYLKYTTPGFVYAAGITPANAAAALASLTLLEASNERVTRLKNNADYFRALLSEQGFNIGPSKDTPIVPLIVGEAKRAIKLADQLFKVGINVHPMFYPSVPQGEARLRFFITSQHSRKELEYTAENIGLFVHSDSVVSA